ncbi:MAG: adenylate/guanylate cyclase domain-containing protein [Eubacteriales bacterium]|nr:adenylate/guanylate cyclase domain-containing protein [Eubacteriales bacterium]
MICFSCGYHLHNGEDKECKLCGMKFAQQCPACGQPSSEYAKFCFSCGTGLSQPGEKSSLENFNILSESRKNVAVIFADVSGFTKLSENMDPEEVRELINDCFNYITRPVYEMEGTIDKFIGDCVMILFGAKYSHADDAKRAVMCAIDMLELIKDFNENYLTARGIALNLSVGVNYGLVVTGSVGNYFDKDYTVMGDTVNTAQRLQSAAGEGTILVSESVYLKTHDVISYSKAREIYAKNKKNPITCYVPLKINSDYSFATELPLMERVNEIELLESIYRKTELKGTQVVSVIGEGGIGKTRLVKEFISAINPSVKKIWFECSHISQKRSYNLIAGILNQIMNINPKDSEVIKQHRLLSFLNYIMPNSGEEEIIRAKDFLGLLTGLGRDKAFVEILNSMTIENIRREMVKQFSMFLTNFSRQNRYVLIVDDIHWADRTSLGLLNDTLPQISEASAMLIFTSRIAIGELLPGLDGKESVINVGTINEESTSELSCLLLNCTKMDEELYNAVWKLSRGNPLYIKEYISAIKRSGRYQISNGTAHIERDAMLSLPDNLQNLVLSSMSELDEPAKEFLEIASVVGKNFNLSFVKNILGSRTEDDDVLRQPMLLNIITLKSVNVSSGKVEKEYSFNHEIEKDAIYDSILNKRKKEYHKRIAEYIENTYGEYIENYYELLCTHFENANMPHKTREYYYKTAIKYRNDFNVGSSLEYYLKFLEAHQGKSTEDKTNYVFALRDVGYIYHLTASYEKALDYFNRAKSAAWLSDDISSVELMQAEVYRDMGEFEAALAILNRLEGSIRQDNILYGKLLQIKCNILRITGNAEALGFAKQSQKILLKAKDYRNLSETMKNAGIIYYSRGEIDNALAFLNKSYKYAEKVNNLEGMAKVSSDLGIIYHSTGMISKAQEFLNKSLEISQKISYPRGYIAACINLGVLYLDKGLFEKSEYLFREALSMSEEIGLRLYECISLTNLGDIMYERNHYSRANDYYKRSETVAREINAPVEEGINLLGAARVKFKRGKYEGMEELLNKAFRIFSESDEIMYLCDYYIIRAKYEMAQGNDAKALETSGIAVEMSMECRSEKKRLKALRSKGWIMLNMGEAQKAVDLFDDAARLSIGIESDYEAAKSYFGMFKSLEAQERSEEAKACLCKASESIKRVDNCRWTKLITYTNRSFKLP